jgi:PAS domain S-box-containing protein
LGTLNIYSAEADAFNLQELELLTQLTDSLSYGILALRAKQKQQQAEAALRLSEIKFSKAFYSSPIANCIISLDEKQFLDVNHGFEQLFGYNREEVIGRTPMELQVWQNLNDRPKMMAQLQAQGSLRNYEARLRKRQGESMVCLLSVELIQVGGTNCILAAIEDITERRQNELKILQLNQELEQRVEDRSIALRDSEQALQKSQEFLQLITDSLPVCIIYLDAEQRHQFVNHTYEVWFKQNLADVLGRTVHEVVGSETYAGIQGYFDRALAGEPVSYEYQFEQEGLNPRILQVAVLPDHRQQQVQGCFVLVSDITNLKLVEQELQRSNQELEQFAYVASHDLQEPLRAVTGYTQLLMSEYGQHFDDTAQSYAEFVIDGAKRMQRLIQDLLAYSRVGTRGKEFTPTDCNQVVQEAIRNLQVAIAERNVAIEVEPLPILNADHNQLVQLFQNLLGNAIKFCKQEPPCIHICATQRETDYLIQVQDNGIGIKPQYLDRIFEVFKRLHTQREYPGTGIGLAICKKIVLRHRGQIWAESTPNVGTTFFFTFPEQHHE